MIVVGRHLVAGLHARDPNVIFGLLDQCAAGRVLDGGNAHPLPVKTAVRADWIAVDENLLASSFNDRRTRAQHDASARSSDDSHSLPAFLIGPRQFPCPRTVTPLDTH